MDIDDSSFLAEKHCELVRNLSQCHFPWLKNNRFSTRPLIYRKRVEKLRRKTHQMWKKFTKENDVHDGSGQWRERFPYECVDIRKMRRKLRLGWKKQIGKESGAKKRLISQSKNLNKFLLNHPDNSEQWLSSCKNDIVSISSEDSDGIASDTASDGPKQVEEIEDIVYDEDEDCNDDPDDDEDCNDDADNDDNGDEDCNGDADDDDNDDSDDKNHELQSEEIVEDSIQLAQEEQECMLEREDDLPIMQSDEELSENLEEDD